MKSSNSVKSSNTKNRRPASALKSSFSRRQPQPPTPPTSSIFAAAAEWLSQRVADALASVPGYTGPVTEDWNNINIKEKRAYKPPPKISISADEHLQQREVDLSTNDAEFYEIAQEILNKADSLSGISTSHFQQTMNRSIAAVLERRGVAPHKFLEALQYRAARIPIFSGPENSSKRITMTKDLALLLNVRQQTSYAGGICEKETQQQQQTTTVPVGQGGQRELFFGSEDLMHNFPQKLSIPSFDHDNYSNNDINFVPASNSFIEGHSNPEQLNQQQYSSSAAAQQCSYTKNLSHPNFPTTEPYLSTTLPYIQHHPYFPAPEMAMSSKNHSPFSADSFDPYYKESTRQFYHPSSSWQEYPQQETNKHHWEAFPSHFQPSFSEPVHENNVRDDDAASYQSSNFDEEEHYSSTQQMELLLSQERQQIMREICYLMDLLSRTNNDPLLYRKYENQLLKLQNQLDSLHDDVNVDDISTLEAPLRTDSIAATEVLNNTHAENSSIASVKISGGAAKIISKEKRNKKKMAESVGATTPVEAVVSPTIDEVLASTYHELADNGAIQILEETHKQVLEPVTLTNGQGPTEKSKQPRKNNKVIQVRAPMTMPEGYTFEAKVGEKVMMVKVPKGGAKRGQIFEHLIEEETQMYIPLGRWRYSLLSCCVLGVLHPMLCNGIFCPQVALSQVMARVHLNACANPVLNIKARANATGVIVASVALIFLHIILIALPFQSGGITIMLMQFVPLAVLDLVIIVYFFVLLVKARFFVRQMYKIDGSTCEDIGKSLFCTFCTIIQMGYHTADYETYSAECCSSTGLPPFLQALSPHSLPPPEFKKSFSMC
mmetsp:Transcript_16215/g.23149  ORF Transcript_16215/g.23149 Transcript_16215/m.23149 type:complete len:833 (+) Transcript_16215:191-2689(+)